MWKIREFKERSMNEMERVNKKIPKRCILDESTRIKQNGKHCGYVHEGIQEADKRRCWSWFSITYNSHHCNIRDERAHSYYT